jgi:hypothetical protein
MKICGMKKNRKNIHASMLYSQREGDSMNDREKMSIQKYYEENKEWLQKVAMSSDIVVRSMALAILELGADPEQ